jgi:GMP synthase (glutamine-hydrolysing)
MATHSGHDLVLVLDFGGQYTQLIARRIREQGVYCEIRPCNEPPERPPRLKGIVFSGGPSSVYDKGAPPFDPRWFDTDVPFLGICYGLQLMAHHLGGKVEPSDHREYGHAQIEILDPAATIFRGVEKGKHDVWMSHGDLVDAPPRGLPDDRVVAELSGGGRRRRRRKAIRDPVPRRGDAHRDRRAHLPELPVRRLRLQGRLDHGELPRGAEGRGPRQGRREHVLCALSGGVDSAVVASLLHQALGDRLHCVFVDNGVLRKGERQAVESEFKDLGVRVVDARERFLQALDGVSDPERKRKIIGETFIRVFEDEAKALERERDRSASSRRGRSTRT